MATFYVATTGSDAAAGSSVAPWRTISHAVAATLNPGDTIIVRPGTYSEQVVMDNGGSAAGYVTLQSETNRAAKIIVAAPTYSALLVRANYIIVDGFDIQGGEGHAVDAQNVHHIKILNSTLHNSGGGGIQFDWSEFVTIENNISHHNCAINGYQPSGISVYECRNITGDTTTTGFRTIVRNNISYSNLATYIGSHSDGNGIIIDDFQNTQNAGFANYTYPTLVENNICYDNGAKGIQVFLSDFVTIRNNACWKNNTDPQNPGTYRAELANQDARNNVWLNNIGVADPSTNSNNVAIQNVGGPNTSTTFFNNLTFNGTVGQNSTRVDGSNPPPTTGNGNKLGVNPLFVSAPTNFHLQSGSPARNAGTSSFGVGTTDLDGNPRVVGAIDMGPYEEGVSVVVISIPDNQPNGAITTLSLTATSGTPDGTGTWTFGNGGYTHCSLSASTGLSVTLNVTGVVTGDIGDHDVTINYSEHSVVATQLTIRITVFAHASFTQLGTIQILNPTGATITTPPWMLETGLVFPKGLVTSADNLAIKNSTGVAVPAGWQRSPPYPDGSIYRCSPRFKVTEATIPTTGLTYTYGKLAGVFDDAPVLTIADIPDGLTVTVVISGSAQAADNGTWTASTTTMKAATAYSSTTGYGTVAGDSPVRGRQLMRGSPIDQEQHMWMCLVNGSSQAHKWLRCDAFALQVSDKLMAIDWIVSHPYFTGPHATAPAGSGALDGSGRIRHYGYNASTDPGGNMTITVKDAAGTTWITKTQLCLGSKRGFFLADTKGFPMVVDSAGILQTHSRALFYVPFSTMTNTTIHPFWCGPAARTAFTSALSSVTVTPYTIGGTDKNLAGDTQGEQYQSGEIEAFLNDPTGPICLTLGDVEKFRDILRIRAVSGLYAHDFHIDPRTGCLLNYAKPGNGLTHAAINIVDHSGERASSWTPSDHIMMSPWQDYLTDGGDTHIQRPFFYPFIAEGRQAFLFGQAVMSNANNTLLYRRDFNVSGTHYYLPAGLFNGALGVRVGLWPFHDAWHTAMLSPTTVHWRGPSEWTAMQTLNGLAAMVNTTLTSIDGDTNPASAGQRLIGFNLTTMADNWGGFFLFSSDNPNGGFSSFDCEYPVDTLGRIANSGGLGATQALTHINGYLKNFHVGQIAAVNNLYVADPGVMILLNPDLYTMRAHSWDGFITGQTLASGAERDFVPGGTRLCNESGQGNEAAGVSGHAQHNLIGVTELMLLGIIPRATWDARMAKYGTTGGTAGIAVFKQDVAASNGGVEVFSRFAMVPPDLNT